jgi:V/A-type H+-transporting ATPase subunit I
MALMPMQKIAVFFPRSERDELLSLLQAGGAVEILDLRETPLADEVEIVEDTGGGESDRQIADLKRTIDILGEFETKGGMFGGLGGGKVMITHGQLDDITEDFDHRAVVEEIDDLEARRTSLKTRRNHLESFIERLEPWWNLDAPLEEITAGATTGVIAGALPANRSLTALVRALEENAETAAAEIVHESERHTYLVIYYHTSEEDAVQETIRRQDLEVHTFEGLEGLSRDLVEKARTEIAEIERESDRLEEHGRRLAENKPRLMIAHDHFAQVAGRTHAHTLVGTTERIGVLQGWIRRQDHSRLVEEIESGVESAAVMAVEPEPGEKPPIELKNRKLLRPFEVITELYGMPHAREVDPTPLAAPFFALFFGFCMTDAGYGIVLCAVSLMLMRWLRTGHKLLWLIFAGGLFTIGMGAITGGWFGLTDAVLPPWLGFVGDMRRSMMVFDPLKDPMLMFGLALALGFIQVTFGLLIEMYENFRSGDVVAGVFDQVTWIVLLWSVLFFGLGNRVASGAYAPIFKWAAIVAAIGILGFSYRASRNPGVRIAWGFYNLYGITGYLGDVLSYARLLALGLATGGIAMVINSVALMTKGIPVVGYPAMIVVLIGGHTLNIAVNALGGFVHSARLQYVEFYPKFFEGGGKRFSPFKKELRYTTLVEKTS